MTPADTAIHAAARLSGLAVDLVRHSHTQEAVMVRRAVYAALQQACGVGPSQIGRMFDRHHSTIISGLRRAEYLVETDPAFAARVNQIAAAVEADESAGAAFQASAQALLEAAPTMPVTELVATWSDVWALADKLNDVMAARLTQEEAV